VDDLCAQVGAGLLTGRQVIETVFPGTRKKPSFYEKVMPLARRGKKVPKKDFNVPLKGLIPGMAVHFAGCCHPLPGDRIVGVVTTGKGVTIHTIDCDSLAAFADAPERWIDVSWDVDDATAAMHMSRLQLIVVNAPGSLGSLTTVIGKNEGNITNLKFTNRTAEFFDMLIDIEVRDVKHLTDIIAALRATPAINSVERARG
jgi:GTP diphosphokinase / guanosine-3',5'-bis(diphosphate) 3'-diphosphatase